MKPTKNRVFCRECNRMKMLFEEEKQALNFLKFNASNFDDKTPVRAYYCDACFGWHLTSREGEAYKNPLTDNVVQDYASSRNTFKKLSGFYSAEVTEGFNKLKSLCCGVVSSKKTLQDSQKRLREMEEQKEKLRPYLSPNDFEVAERVVEDARIKIAKKFSL